MEALSPVLLLIGLIIFIIGGIWYLVTCFKKSIWWGLGCIFLPVIQIIFLFVHWSVAAKPFGIQTVGIVIMFAGAYLE